MQSALQMVQHIAKETNNKTHGKSHCQNMIFLLNNAISVLFQGSKTPQHCLLPLFNIYNRFHNWNEIKNTPSPLLPQNPPLALELYD